MHQARTLATAYFWNKWYQKINSEERYSLDIPKDWALEIINEDEFFYYANINSGKQIKQGISVHLNLK